ncbi:cytochrome P450 [Legionella jordanis]|nr:cytochrome P450 [Legionella jordanis]HAT8713163.1 cytochrome P450 [Legionella jordanis]
MVKTKMHALDEQDMQSRFMKFIANLGQQSLTKQGIAYFRLPDFRPVYVISNPKLIEQLYSASSQHKFSQKKFFNRLAMVLGPNNLMSSDLGSDFHRQVRASILSRNEAIRPQLAMHVMDFFKEYQTKQREKRQTLATFMDALSRKILLVTYFGKEIIDEFEELYQPHLTKQLIECLFNLDPITDKDSKKLLALRNEIFSLSCRLIFSPELNSILLKPDSWLVHLLKTHLASFKELRAELEDISVRPEVLDAEQCQKLLNYARQKGDSTTLSRAVRDVVNESLFIPLLGFDATATTLIAALKIAIQDKRVYKILKQEIQEHHASSQYVLRSAWDSDQKRPLTYAEAVVLEALRIAPPAMLIPEMVREPIKLKIEGEEVILTANSLLFIPLESVHKQPANFPDIPLSAHGQKILGKPVIKSCDIFPERWLPQSLSGEPYHLNFFQNSPSELFPRQLEKQGRFLTFKTGARRCPGLRLAFTEILLTLTMLHHYEIELEGEEELHLRFNYHTALQRNGGSGLITLQAAKQAENVFREREAREFKAIERNREATFQKGGNKLETISEADSPTFSSMNL